MNISKIKKFKKFTESGDFQNTTIDRLSERYSQQFQESISHLDILFNSDRANTIYKNDVAIKCIVDYGKLPKKSSGDSQLSKEVWTKHNDGIKTGDIVEFAHIPYSEVDRNTYIFTDSVDTRDGYNLNIMKPCLSSLKWLNEDGVIQETPFTYRSSSATNFGVTDDRILVLDNERRQLIIQSNKETKSIKKNKRFIFDERCWKVTALDRLKEGLIYLTLEENEINPAKDNTELRIADYFGNVVNFSIKILNNDFSIFAGTWVQINVEVKNNDILVDKEITFESSNESVATIDHLGVLSTHSNGGSIITAKITDHPDISDEMTVTVEPTSTSNFSISVPETPLLIKGSTKKFSAIIRNNSTFENKDVVWTIFETDNLTPTSIATLVSFSNTECVIKGIGLGWFHLKASLLEKPDVISIIPIQIKSLI